MGGHSRRSFSKIHSLGFPVTALCCRLQVSKQVYFRLLNVNFFSPMLFFLIVHSAQGPS